VSSYATCVSAYYYTCVRGWKKSDTGVLCSRTTNYLTVCILQYVCPHTTICVSSYILLYMCPHTAISVPSYYCICALILLYVCPHTAIYVSAYCLCVLILQYVSSNYFICVLILFDVSSSGMPHCTCSCAANSLHNCCYICVLVYMRVNRPTNAYVWHEWVLREVGDVCAVFQH